MRVPGWVVTYGDMMSLLLCFFVLLLSFSTISEDSFNEAMMSLQGALGVLDRFDALNNPVPKRPKKTLADIEKMARKLRRQMQIMAHDSDVEVEFDELGGLKINLPSGILFVSGNADLRPEAYPVLAELGTVLRDVPDSFIEVRGHTDGRPLRGNPAFLDNYDLSYARANVVTRRLNEMGGVPLNQFEITACGPSQPVATNDTPEGRQVNRRVEIFVRGAFNRDSVEELRRKADTLSQEYGTATAPVTP